VVSVLSFVILIWVTHLIVRLMCPARLDSASENTPKVESTASTVTATEGEASDKKHNIKLKAGRLPPEEMEGRNFIRVPVIVKKKGDTEK
jgi:hypothetical protein